MIDNVGKYILRICNRFAINDLIFVHQTNKR